MICCLQGGMGNQMFQYAMARAASIRLKTDLFLNTRRFNNDSLGRRYSLGLWEGIKEYPRNDEPHPIIENGLPYNKEILNLIHKDSSIIGYWQSEKYFFEIADLLRKEFTPKQPMTRHGLITQQLIREAGDASTFLTVRRTDYLTSDFHGILSSEYYAKALEIIATKVTPKIFVFSDDPDWCKFNLNLPYPFIVAGNFDRTTKHHIGREDEELTLMKQCKNAVMANSSYSWWGAWLNPDPGIIVAPKTWFLSTQEDPKDIVPDRWMRV